MRISSVMRRPYRWALGITLVMLGLWFLQFLLPVRWADRRQVTVAFLGYTNIAPGMSAAIFGFTNRSKYNVKLWSGCDIWIEGARVPVPSTTRFLETNLGPRKSLSTVIGLPPRPAKWRARWGFSLWTLQDRLVESLKKTCPWKVIQDLEGPYVNYGLETEWLSP